MEKPDKIERKPTRVTLQRIYLDAKFSGPEDVEKPGWNYKVIEVVNVLRPDVLPGMWLREVFVQALIAGPDVDEVAVIA